MISPLPPTLQGLVYKAYSDAYALHGDLGLEIDKLEGHLLWVIDKRLGSDAMLSDSLPKLFEKLHTADLYLAVACAEGSDRAWNRFMVLYRGYLHDLARQSRLAPHICDTLAESVFGHLFMPDRSGRCRIASYDGQISLAAWLSVIVSHLAANERKRHCNVAEQPLECAREIADERGPNKLEAAIRSKRYHGMLDDSYQSAICALKQRDRLILVLLYRDRLAAKEVAEGLGLHPSTVSCLTKRIRETLRDNIISNLAGKHRLCPAAIAECLQEAVENPDHSLLRFLASP